MGVAHLSEPVSVIQTFVLDNELEVPILSSDTNLADERYEGGNEALGTSAYVVVDKANCLYRPDLHSAVRVSPSYGAEVSVVRDQGFWVLISFCGKEAWSPRLNLSANLAPQRPALDVGVVPLPNYTFRPPVSGGPQWPSNVEYGPRGGRFVRTSSGFRRYF